MAKFKIIIDLGVDTKLPDSPLKKYPNISSHDAAIFVWAFSGSIYIELNDKPAIQTDDGYETDYLWHFFMSLMYAVSLIVDGKEGIVNFLDSDHFIAFNRIEDNVLIRFGIGSGESPETLREVTSETIVSFEEFVEESFKALENFINQLMAINPKLTKSDELKQLIEARDKAKKAIEEYKIDKKNTKSHEKL